MAIALDTSAVSTDQTASPITWNHTCTGSNLMLVVGVTLWDQTGPTATAVTYNGVSMVKARADTNNVSGAYFSESSIWLLAAPATGTHQVSVSATLGTTPHGVGASASYTGAQSSSTADASGGAAGTATGSQSFTVTTVANNAWIAAVGIAQAAISPTLTANQTSRQTQSIASAVPSVMTFEDTNAAQTPAGAKTVGFTVGGTSLNGFAMTGASFAPSTAVTDTVSVSDSITTSESVNLTLVDNVNKSDTVTSTESIKLLVESNVNVNDADVLTESIKLLTEENIVVSDSTTLSENVIPLIPTLLVSVSDTTTTSESIQLQQLSFINVSDSTALTENINFLETSSISVSDSTTLSESIIMLSIESVNVSDTVTTNESINLFLPALSINVQDSTTLSETAIVSALIGIDIEPGPNYTISGVKIV